MTLGNERTLGAPPALPTMPARARVVMNWHEAGEHQTYSDEAWVLIDGPWLHAVFDEYDEEGWQSWPMSAVTCVMWKAKT